MLFIVRYTNNNNIIIQIAFRYKIYFFNFMHLSIMIDNENLIIRYLNIIEILIKLIKQYY